MEDTYLLSQNMSGMGNITEAGRQYQYIIPPNNQFILPTNNVLNPNSDPIYRNLENNINSEGSAMNANNINDINTNEPKEADISVFTDLENNVPDFFVYNITENEFVIFIATAALLASARINNKIISFLLFVVISLLVSTDYGVSLAIVFYAIFFVDDMDIFVIILVVLALLHIFLPIPGLVTETFNWNYIIQAVLGILLLLSINRNWRKVFCIDNKDLKFNKLYVDNNTNGLSSNITY
ncbi:unknown similar to AMEV157 [Mythimna separata entomopoxvirus 'L']|uniref:Uncharacterized protein n=1 Tax=Mythimna separata entomopoxvirus 'L' TaxID=1293572 RepID=A0A916KQB6_9POXV|nr:unknown similar to AMEV157 [Mythimna separata entomopoxvirus 'L']CCU56392.1 unknown similar to AMEV157 [Mythimna separata entomopoxvirus 'L']